MKALHSEVQDSEDQDFAIASQAAEPPQPNLDHGADNEDHDEFSSDLKVTFRAGGIRKRPRK